MERLADIALISKTAQRDEIGQIRAIETERTMLCSIHGITRAEWSSAAQQGLQPTFMCLLRDSADYRGENTVMMDGVRYSVYRTYLRDDGGIELYLRQDIGA